MNEQINETMFPLPKLDAEFFKGLADTVNAHLGVADAVRLRGMGAQMAALAREVLALAVNALGQAKPHTAELERYYNLLSGAQMLIECFDKATLRAWLDGILADLGQAQPQPQQQAEQEQPAQPAAQ